MKSQAASHRSDEEMLNRLDSLREAAMEYYWRDRAEVYFEENVDVNRAFDEAEEYDRRNCRLPADIWNRPITDHVR